jgi:hypothetical protein
MKATKLTLENVRDNLLVIASDNKEWGTFRILNKYDKGIWEIRGKSGERVLFENEFKFWELI